MTETAPSAVWEAEAALDAHWQSWAAWAREVLAFKGWRDAPSTPEGIAAELATLAEVWPQVPATIQATILQAIGVEPGALPEAWPTMPGVVRLGILKWIVSTAETLARAARLDLIEQRRKASDAGDGAGRGPKGRGWRRWKRRAQR